MQSRASSKRESRSMQELLDVYFGKDEDLSKDDLFLKRFVSQRVGGCPSYLQLANKANPQVCYLLCMWRPKQELSL